MESNGETSDTGGIERRSILKNIGLGGLLATVGASGEAGATHRSDCYEVGVYLSQTVYNDTGNYQAQQYAMNEVGGTFSNTDGICVVGLEPEETIHPPYEDASRSFSFEACYPCDKTFCNIQYDNLHDWWEDRVSCTGENSIETAADSTLLLTGDSGDGGDGVGSPSGTLAVADSGLLVNDTDGQYKKFTDDSLKEFGLITITHEVGHNILQDPATNNNFDSQHQVHKTINRSGLDYETIMNAGHEPNQENECGYDVAQLIEGFAHIYSGCCTSFMRTSNYEGDPNHCNLTTATVGKGRTRRSIKRFRYSVMSKTPIGRGLMKLYYWISPAPARTISHAPDLPTSKATRKLVERAGTVADKRNRASGNVRKLLLSVTMVFVYLLAVLFSLIGHLATSVGGDRNEA